MSVSLEYSSRAPGRYLGYKELTPQEKRNAEKESARLRKHFGFK